MRKQYFATQDIFNKVFQPGENTIRANSSTQDCLNAVYDSGTGSLRINLVGGILPAVEHVEDLPQNQKDGAIAPVISGGKIIFYEYRNGKWHSLAGAGGGEANLPSDQQDALVWLTENLSIVQDATSPECTVKCEVLALTPDTSVPVILNIQGQFQDIDDDGDRDGDAATHYRIDINGYVLGIETYADSEASMSDRYYTKMVYEPKDGSHGVSHIYLAKDEYEYFSNLEAGKNILKVFYLPVVQSKVISVIETTYKFYADGLVSDNGTNCPVTFTDGVAVVKFNGYILGVETYATSDSTQEERILVKMNYDIENDFSRIYFDEEMYQRICNYENGKNVMQISVLIKKENNTTAKIEALEAKIKALEAVVFPA